MTTALQRTRPGYGRQISAAASYESAADLVAAHYLTLRRKATELAEATYWLGAAVARAESLSSYGDFFFAQLSEDVGVSAGLLRRAMDWYDLCGSEGEMRRQLREAREAMTARDVEALISGNGERKRLSREDRRYRDRMRSAGMAPRLERPKLPDVRPARYRTQPNSLWSQLAAAKLDLAQGAAEALVRTVELPSGRRARLILVLEDPKTDA